MFITNTCTLVGYRFASSTARYANCSNSTSCDLDYTTVRTSNEVESKTMIIKTNKRPKATPAHGLNHLELKEDELDVFRMIHIGSLHRKRWPMKGEPIDPRYRWYCPRCRDGPKDPIIERACTGCHHRPTFM